MIKTATQYYHAVTNFNRDRARAELDALPKNLNPTGKTWRKHYQRIQNKHNVTL